MYLVIQTNQHGVFRIAYLHQTEAAREIAGLFEAESANNSVSFWYRDPEDDLFVKPGLGDD